MQSTFRPTRAPFGFSRVQLLALSLAAGLLALSIVGYVVRHDSAAAPSRQQAVTTTRAANFRFIEANLTLPNVSRVTVNSAHMLEINQLPEAAPAVASNAHMLEINALPGDAASLVPSLATRTHFLESNQLPGDGAGTQAPGGVLNNRR